MNRNRSLAPFFAADSGTELQNTAVIQDDKRRRNYCRGRRRMRTPWQLLLVAVGPAPAVRLAVSGYLERPALLAGRFNGWVQLALPCCLGTRCWAPSAGPHPGHGRCWAPSAAPCCYLARRADRPVAARLDRPAWATRRPWDSHNGRCHARQRSGRGPHQSLCWLAT